MNKKNRNIGQEILSGLQEIKRGEHGRIITVPDIAQTRAKVGLSQTQFAQLMGVSVRTLQDWEQGAAASIWCSPDTTDDRRQKPSSYIGCDVRT